MHVFAASTVLLLALFLRTHRGLTPRQQSWILTCAGSLIMTAIGCVQVFVWIWVHNMSFENLPRSMLVMGDAGSQFFMSYLICDLVIGAIYYRSSIGLLTGWIHHIAYIALLAHLSARNLSPIFHLFSVLEFPTLVLSLGNLDKRNRHDILFGTSYFFTRLVFHGFLIFQMAVAHFTSVPQLSHAYIYPLLVLPVHVHWMRGWVVQQMRLSRLERSGSTDISINDTLIKESLKAPPFSSSAPKLRLLRPDYHVVRRPSLHRHFPSCGDVITVSPTTVSEILAS